MHWAYHNYMLFKTLHRVTQGTFMLLDALGGHRIIELGLSNIIMLLNSL